MHDIFNAISVYAEAYKLLEGIQRDNPSLLPRGDQKTGVIAEFYSRLYAAARFGAGNLEFGSTSEHAWDITAQESGGRKLKIQVKAVSAHAEKGRISTIHPGWDELWLMRLTEELAPEAFWIHLKERSAWAAKTLQSRTMPRPGRPGSGSSEFQAGEDRLAELLMAVQAANQPR
ncbi:MAG: hypothetical protein RLY71_4557 [Pseudomonadota bacterium]|jgi:hypothetical protein